MSQCPKEHVRPRTLVELLFTLCPLSALQALKAAASARLLRFERPNRVITINSAKFKHTLDTSEAELAKEIEKYVIWLKP